MDIIKLFILGAVGAAGYLFLGLYDAAQLKKNQRLSRVFAFGFFLAAIPYLLLFFTFVTPHLRHISIPLLLLAITAGGATGYIVLLEIPKNHHNHTTVYDRGTYARVRHPGFLTHFVLNTFIVLYFFNLEVLLLCTVYVICNLILITVEDIYLFPRLFVDYDAYKERTGFLIPKRRK
ncbi:MAG TPA: hypothetical protein VFC80_06260 [Sphaerochaeta sp.]|nr:hypothetical protein [Sphaerochaeta sp.]